MDCLSKIGTATTEIITPDDDAYIDNVFFIILDISDSDFTAPFDISMKGSQCGTFDVQMEEKTEIPYDYNLFLFDPADLTVTSEDGDGAEAYLKQLMDWFTK